MKGKILMLLFIGSIVVLTSCGKNEECVCDNSENISDTDAKDAGVSLNEACELAKNGDESCNIE